MTVKIEGLRELDRALGELPKATGKNVLRRVIKARLQPVEAMAKALVPVDEGHLRASIITGSRLNRREASQAKKDGPAFVEMHTGTNSRNGVPREFGTTRTRATPFMRPAWDANQDNALVGIAADLGKEIDKAAARLARKAGRG